MNVRIKYWNGKKKVWEERVYYCVEELYVESKYRFEEKDRIKINGIELKV